MSEANVKQHKWAHDADGLMVCRNRGCTVRSTTTEPQAWQRSKGGHWRTVNREPVPACTSGRKSK